MPNADFSILYVDDEDQNLFSFKAAFRREYRIYTAQTGEAALTLMRQKPIHLVITDQRMPKVTGVELLETIRKEFPRPIRMILTGYSDVEAIIRAINDGGVFRYITKPWDKDDFRLSIENARQLYDLSERNRSLVADLQRNVAELQKTVQIFSKYVPQPIVETALSSQEGPIIKGEILEATVMFCDIRNFTGLSEEFPPELVVEVLNTFYSYMTEVINHYNGSVNQFIGDEIYATFGAPVASPAHQSNAVFCALEMIKKRDELSDQFRGQLGRSIDVGIGIHTGNVVAGNMGSADRINYAVVGDTVNTCKRIESLTRDKPNAVLISAPVYQKVQDLVVTRDLDIQAVRGKKEKVRVYEVLDKREKLGIGDRSLASNV
ncbi:MAG: adenylate/guanylate cyclase domain-containing protein [Cyanobacteria bacterium P01_A01_bin.123]